MTPLVSILVVTYNQADYIEKCLDSLSEQNCDFQYEIIVCDDHSTDKTFEKCEAIAKLSPRVKVHRQDENVGVNQNLAFGLEQCQGQYIAFCDGDDYWTHPKKLQMMSYFLENDDTCSITYSDFGKMNDQSEILEKATLLDQPERFTLNDLIDKQGPAVSAMMLRKSTLPNQYPTAFFRVLNPDIFLLAWSLSKGYGHFIDQPMSMYRVHEGGIWSGLAQTEKRLLQLGTRILVFGSLGSEFRSYRDECVARMEQLLSNTKREGHKDLFNQYKGFLPLRSRISFHARRLYAKLFVRD